CAASMGTLSPRIVAVGVKERGESVTLIFRVDAPGDESYPEINQVIEDFDDLTGNVLDITIDLATWDQTENPPDVIWTYQRWLGDEHVAGLELLDARADYAMALEAFLAGRSG